MMDDKTRQAAIDQTLESLTRFRRVLATLRKDVPNDSWFELLAEGPREVIARLERDLKELRRSD
jgi:hypothetical protein